MKFLIVLLALCLSSTQGKKDKAIFGKSLTHKEARKLQTGRAARRSTVKVVEQPEKRRLTKSHRQLPYHSFYDGSTEEPTIEPTLAGPSDDAFGKGYGGKGGFGKGKGGRGMGNGGRGKGGMMGSRGKAGMSGGMMSGGMMSGKGGKGGPYPTYDDAPYLDDLIYDDYFPTDECQMITFNETFAILGPSVFLAPPDETPDVPTTVFIFEPTPLLELDGVTEIEGSSVTGTCTRTLIPGPIGNEGGGVCQFVFIDDEGYSISVDGFLTGPLGGPLAITGGTGSMVGVFGQFDFFPIFSDTDVNATGDIFLDAIEYEVLADIGVVVCPQ